MKKTTSALIALLMIIFTACPIVAQEAPDAYMELSVTGDWHIFSKDMENEELLDAVGMSAGKINKILEDSASESVIINSATGAQVFVKVKQNTLSNDLWNIQGADDGYLLEQADTILTDGFNVAGLDYSKENIIIRDCAYMKQITAYGSTFYEREGHGIVVSGTFVNGYAIVFMQETDGIEPTQEEVLQVQELMSGVSFTVIKDKENDRFASGTGDHNVFRYILGGFGALVVIIFCVYMIERLKHRDENTEKADADTDESKV